MPETGGGSGRCLAARATGKPPICQAILNPDVARATERVGPGSSTARRQACHAASLLRPPVGGSSTVEPCRPPWGRGPARGARTPDGVRAARGRFQPRECGLAAAGTRKSDRGGTVVLGRAVQCVRRLHLLRGRSGPGQLAAPAPGPDRAARVAPGGPACQRRAFGQETGQRHPRGPGPPGGADGAVGRAPLRAGRLRRRLGFRGLSDAGLVRQRALPLPGHRRLGRRSAGSGRHLHRHPPGRGAAQGRGHLLRDGAGQVLRALQVPELRAHRAELAGGPGRPGLAHRAFGAGRAQPPAPGDRGAVRALPLPAVGVGGVAAEHDLRGEGGQRVLHPFGGQPPGRPHHLLLRPGVRRPAAPAARHALRRGHRARLGPLHVRQAPAAGHAAQRLRAAPRGQCRPAGPGPLLRAHPGRGLLQLRRDPVGPGLLRPQREGDEPVPGAVRGQCRALRPARTAPLGNHACHPVRHDGPDGWPTGRTRIPCCRPCRSWNTPHPCSSRR